MQKPAGFRPMGGGGSLPKPIRAAGSVGGLCDVCGAAGALFTCTLCGKRVCSQHFHAGVCSECRKGRMLKGQEKQGSAVESDAAERLKKLKKRLGRESL